jgi:tetratricopeptide (TPR) repeat protein
MRKNDPLSVFIIAGIFIFTFYAVKPTSADTIFLDSSDSVRSVTVVDFKQGELEVLDRSGGRKTFAYDDVACLRIDGEPDLNDGERLLRLKNWNEAAKSYRKVMAGSNEKKIWIKIWSRARLMNLLARQGAIDEAAEVYIDLAEKIPEWVVTISPTQKDFKADAAAMDRAGAKLVKARDASKSGQVREAIAKFYQRIGCEKKLPEAKPIATAVGDEKDFEKYDQPGPWLDAWAEAKIKAGRPAAVLKVVNRLFETSLRRNLPAIFYWKGRVFLAQQDYDNAGLNFLRVAIEFPSSTFTPDALLQAGRSANLAGHLNYAKRIWQELIDTYGNSNDYRIIQMVEEARDDLRGKE